MEEIDAKVARVLNEKHDRRADQINADRELPELFDVGDEVWYLRPEGSGDKLDTRWLGPVKIVAKNGEHSYMVKLDPDVAIRVHATFLKKYVVDEFKGRRIPLFFPPTDGA